jgi:leucyl-tRNA synthetase
MDFLEIQKKWQEKWEKEKIFYPKVDEKKDKYYITAAYPYPNSPQHIGHARTYTIADVCARFNRMLNKNVLFPMGFHVTGTPIFGMAKRIEEKDQQIIEVFEKIYGIEKDTIAGLSDPKKLVYYFANEIEQGMKKIGYSIDWSRKFYTFDEHYSKFIEWQFKKLHQAGLIEQGEHPVPWCPKDGQAVGSHDILGDIDPEIEKVMIILFYEPESKVYFPAATYRPDTLDGVTNIWINKEYDYVIAEYDNKKFVLSKVAAELLSEQLELKNIKKINISEFLLKEVINPLNNQKVLILNASFVKQEIGTGVVMSVPAHAPYDYVAIKNLPFELQEKLKEKIKATIRTPGLEKFPAVEIVEKNKILDQNDPRLEDLTKEIYSKEAHQGEMITKGFEGLSAIDGKEKIKQKLIENKNGFEIYVLANGPIYSRTKNLCTVKIVKNQWFIKYNEIEWKKKTHNALKDMEIIPQKLRKEFEYTIDWLDKKACTRAKGFGTKFPFDKTQVIEALSDSTIYMAYYTISHICKEIDPNELTEEFFDYVFLGKNSKNKKPFWDKAKKEFEYWYPLDRRHSAIDLVHNHLTFFIFNHVAIFDKKYWPKGIVANGLVTMEGQKMSKSMGNILPLQKAIDQYGADLIRLAVSSTADIDMDCDFSKAVLEGARNRLNFFYNLVEKYKDQKPEDKILDNPTKWFYSKLHLNIAKTKELYNKLELKKISSLIFYEAYNDINWYMKRTNKPYLREFLEYWVAMICPIMPHIAEELWEKLGKKYYLKDSKFVSNAHYPTEDKNQIDEEIEKQEDYLKIVLEDIEEIKKIAKINEPKKVVFIVYGKYKEKVLEIIKEKKDIKESINQAIKEKELKEHKNKLFELINKFAKNIGTYNEYKLNSQKEFLYLEQEKEFIKNYAKAKEIEIIKEEDAPIEFSKKAVSSMPLKPAIIFL